MNVAFADLLAQEGNNDFAENLARSIHIPQATSDNVEARHHFLSQCKIKPMIYFLFLFFFFGQDCIRLAMLYRSLGHSKDFLAVALPVVSQSIASELVARGLETEDYAERCAPFLPRGEGKNGTGEKRRREKSTQACIERRRLDRRAIPSRGCTC